MRTRLEELKQRRERLAEAVDQRHNELLERQNNALPTAVAERELDEAEVELKSADKEMTQGRVKLQRLDAEVQSATDALEDFSRNEELAEAPSRFEDMAGRAYGFLAAVGAAAIVTAVQLNRPDTLVKIAVWLACASSAIAFLVFLPTLASAIIDTRRARGRNSGKGATAVRWGPAVAAVRLAGFVIMFALSTTSWILLLIHFGRQ
jgi:chromosome segregation ATPase